MNVKNQCTITFTWGTNGKYIYFNVNLKKKIGSYNYHFDKMHTNYVYFQPCIPIIKFITVRCSRLYINVRYIDICIDGVKRLE